MNWFIRLLLFSKASISPKKLPTEGNIKSVPEEEEGEEIKKILWRKVPL